MHELAITERVVDIVSERAGAAKVTRVQLEIGKLTGIMPDSVRFCFDVCAAGSALAGARLEIVEPAGRARCRDCEARVAMDDFLARCPCGSTNLQLLSGQELRIVEVDLA